MTGFGALAIGVEEALAAGSIMALLGAFFAVFIVAVIVWYVLQVIAYWRIFTKAGEAGWKALIPIYNTYIQYKISWSGWMFLVLIALSAAQGVMAKLSQDGGSAVFTILAGVLALAMLVFYFLTSFKLSEAFGHGLGFAIGLFLLQPVFVLILGLGYSVYIGPNGLPKRY